MQPPCVCKHFKDTVIGKQEVSRFLPHFILTATGLSEVSHRGELSMNGLSIKPAVVQVNHSLFRIFFTAKLKAKLTFFSCYREATEVDQTFLSHQLCSI